jgi:hypothetical protein
MQVWLTVCTIYCDHMNGHTFIHILRVICLTICRCLFCDNTRHLRQTGWSSTDPVRPNILAGVLRYTGDKQSKLGAYKCMYL